MFGYVAGSSEAVRFVRADGLPDTFFTPDKEVSLDDEIRCPLPRAPTEVMLSAHWLAVDGVQPATPDNPPVEERQQQGLARAAADTLAAAAAGPAGAPKPAQGAAAAAAGAPGSRDVVTVVPVVAHIISKELQLYFDKVTDLVVAHGLQAPRQVYESLASDAGLQPLAPYFSQWIADTVAQHMTSLPVLRGALAAAAALVSNRRVTLEQYLHQLMPPLITCLVAKRLGASPAQDHWALRHQAAACLAAVCARHGASYPAVQPRLTRTLVAALLDPQRPMATHYGALTGLAALGPWVVQALVVPNAGDVLHRVAPLLQPQQGEGENTQQGGGGEDGDPVAARARRREVQQAQYDAQQVLGALLASCGGCMYEVLRYAATPVPGSDAARAAARRRAGATAAGVSSLARPSTDAGKGGASVKGSRTPGPDEPQPAQQAQGGAVSGEGHRVPETHLVGATGKALELAWRGVDADACRALAALVDLHPGALAPYVPVGPLAFLTV